VALVVCAPGMARGVTGTPITKRESVLESDWEVQVLWGPR